VEEEEEEEEDLVDPMVEIKEKCAEEHCSKLQAEVNKCKGHVQEPHCHLSLSLPPPFARA